MICKRLLHKKLINLSIIAVLTIFVVMMASWQQVLAATSQVSEAISSPDWYYLIIPTCAGLLIRHQIRQPSTQKQKPLLNEYEIAYLAGGEVRAIKLAITKLTYQGYLKVNRKHRTFEIAKYLKTADNILERQIMDRVCFAPDFRDLRLAKYYQTNHVRRRLEKLGLKASREKCIAVDSFADKVGYAFIFGFVWLRFLFPLLLITELPFHQSGFFLLGTMVFILCLMVVCGRTYWGDLVLTDFRKNSVGCDPIEKFALYGEASLSGGVLNDLKRVYEAQQREDNPM